MNIEDLKGELAKARKELSAHIEELKETTETLLEVAQAIGTPEEVQRLNRVLAGFQAFRDDQERENRARRGSDDV